MYFQETGQLLPLVFMLSSCCRLVALSRTFMYNFKKTLKKNIIIIFRVTLLPVKILNFFWTNDDMSLPSLLFVINFISLRHKASDSRMLHSQPTYRSLAQPAVNQLATSTLHQSPVESTIVTSFFCCLKSTPLCRIT